MTGSYDFFVLDYPVWVNFTMYTKYILVPLVLVVGYGVARFLAIIPPIFVGRSKTPKSGNEA